jgi:hypothetical protein
MKKLLTMPLMILGIMSISMQRPETKSSLFVPAKREIKANLPQKTFDPGDFFRDRQDEVNLSVWDSFKDNILQHAKTADKQEEISFRSQDLKIRSNDSAIINDLGLKPMKLEDVWAVAALIMRQPKGESGDLTNNGYANLFYVETGSSFSVIALRWEDAGNEWLVGSCKLNALTGWSSGVRVFSLN